MNFIQQNYVNNKIASQAYMNRQNEFDTLDQLPVLE